ncbi:MAG: chemotaxis signal relay system inhibitor of MCP methylation protein CheC [Bacteroidetes bacterium HLUCCA01]|nr:MAG: chemotaxis signal relay system inhibitor of MCP methylation protein CheC [Bacteroidetes bacterium HLUCCA01]
MNSDLNEQIRVLALRAFESMCFMFEMDDDFGDGDMAIATDYKDSVVIRFDGDVNGGMLISASPDLRQAAAMNMLGTDDVDEQHKKDACFELANIICGNIVPLLNKNDGVSFIQSPRTATKVEASGAAFKGFHEEVVSLSLDEGTCEIRVYYL